MSNSKTEWQWPRWLTLYLLMLVVLLAAGCAIYLSRPKSSGRFVILQLNDVYRIEGIEKQTIGGLARVRTIRRHLEKQGVPVLTLHAGDMLYPSVMSKYLDAEPMIRALNRLDGDFGADDPNLVATFGNHEFEEPQILLARILESKFSWVSSNVRYRSADGVPEPLSRRFPNVHDEIVRDLDGTRVGIFGITCDAEEADGVTYNYDDERARDEAVRAALSRLEEKGARVIIALTHQDLEEDIRIAKAFPKIHLIVGGHEHSFLSRREGGTLITKADADARSVLRIDVRVARDGRVTAAPEKIDVGPEIRPDDEMNTVVKESLGRLESAIKAKYGKGLNASLGSTQHTLEGVETAIRTRETALGDFLADVMRAHAKTSIALLNGGSIRINDNIPAGSAITLYDMEGIFYYDNAVATIELTGEQVLELLRNSVSRLDRGDGRFLQVSGLRFGYRVEGTPETPIYKVLAEDVSVLPPDKPENSPAGDYLPLDPKGIYTVAIPKYLWEKGEEDGYSLFPSKKEPSFEPAIKATLPSLRAITETTLSGLPGKKVTTGIDGRIRRL